MRLVRNIQRTPANAASMKMAHFSNIGVSEVFLEATPTAFITTILLYSVNGNRMDDKDGGLYDVLIGSGWSATIFYLGYVTSILSSAFGVSR